MGALLHLPVCKHSLESSIYTLMTLSFNDCLYYVITLVVGLAPKRKEYFDCIPDCSASVFKMRPRMNPHVLCLRRPKVAAKKTVTAAVLHSAIAS